jgi:deazaflavin-dependent oxidoreductase (nitroreductase family)
MIDRGMQQSRRKIPARVPPYIRVFNPLARVLLSAGVPMGPEVLLTARGRRTGLRRSTPVAVAEIAGRRWLVAPFGETDWVRNVRADAGRAVLSAGRRSEPVTARELDREETLRFFAEILNPYLRTNPLARWIVRVIDRIPQDPAAAADTDIVFEIRRRDA